MSQLIEIADMPRQFYYAILPEKDGNKFPHKGHIRRVTRVGWDLTSVDSDVVLWTEPYMVFDDFRQALKDTGLWWGMGQYYIDMAAERDDQYDWKKVNFVKVSQELRTAQARIVQLEQSLAQSENHNELLQTMLDKYQSEES